MALGKREEKGTLSQTSLAQLFGLHSRVQTHASLTRWLSQHCLTGRPLLPDLFLVTRCQSIAHKDECVSPYWICIFLPVRNLSTLVETSRSRLSLRALFLKRTQSLVSLMVIAVFGLDFAVRGDLTSAVGAIQPNESLFVQAHEG